MIEAAQVHLDSEGMIIGGRYHDSCVQEIMSEIENEIKIICAKTDESKLALTLKGVRAGNVQLKTGDIITDIFYWKRAKLIELQDGVWNEILENFDHGNSKSKVLEEVGKYDGLLQIYCATKGSASLIISTFDFTVIE